MFEKMLHAVRKKLASSSRVRLVSALAVVGVFAVLGIVLIQLGGAATPSVQMEAENGQPSGNLEVDRNAAGASGNAAVRFKAGTAAGSDTTPTFAANVLVAGLAQPWDIAFLPTGEFIFSQKAGSLSFYQNGNTTKIADIANVLNQGEGGLMGVTVDPQFATNRYIYACYQSQVPDVRVTRWKLNAANNGLEAQKEVITGIKPGLNGRHSGCRIDFGADGYLWVGTGDGAYAGTPQDLQGLAGKILRVDRDGNAAPGNLGGGADPRIFSYGHRNVQGIALFPVAKNGVWGLSDEHGTNADDEVNELRTGNFGWSSLADGEDTGPMTDKGRFPNAIGAIWSSGIPTQAPSGSTIVTGAQWKGWNGAMAIAMLKAKHLKVFRLDAQNKITKEEKVLDGTYGRLRTVQESPDGSLYITTDNKTDDKIIRLTPQ